MLNARFPVAAGVLLLAWPMSMSAAPDDPGPWRPGHDERQTTQTYEPHPLGAQPRTSAPASAALPGFFATQVNVDGAGQNMIFDAANEPSIAVDPTAPNRIVIGWRQFDTQANNFRQAGYAWSNDGGRTWTFPGVIQPGLFRSDPVLDADDTGLIYYYSLRGNFLTDFFLSDDGGQTWMGPFPAFGGDKQWFTLDQTGGPGHGNIYAAWSPFAGCCGNETFIRSVDTAMSFAPPIVVPGTPFFGVPDVGPDGALWHCGGNPQNFSQGWVARSTNAQFAGESVQFDNFVPVDLGGAITLSAGPNPGGLLGQIWLRTNHAPGELNGQVYLLCTVDPPGPDPLDVHFIRSNDGLTWSSPIRVHPEDGGGVGPPPSWQWFGTMDVAPNGRIDVVYNDTVGNPETLRSATYYVFSTDGGGTWSDPEQLTPEWDPFVGYPQQQKIGDYYELISDDVGAHLAYAATFNGEQDVYYLRIGDYDCNGNGVGDVIDLANGDAQDCNDNDIPDSCEIAAGAAADENGDGVPDECGPACVADLTKDGVVGPDDLAALLAQWGSDGDADLDESGVVDAGDLAILLAAWGDCD